MVQRRDLNAPPKQAMADLVRQLRERAESSKTGAHGIKDLGDSGNTTWTDGDGERRSVRDMQAEVDEFRARIADARDTIESSQQQIDEAMAALDAMGDLTTEGPPPLEPVVGKSLWVSPEGVVYRAVECE